MGKRKSGKGGLTGLSGFVINAFKQAETRDEAVTSSMKPPTPAMSKPGPVQREEERPTKRRKTTKAQDTSFTAREQDDWDTNWSYVEKYDATGMVPHYTKATEVPEHLKKYFSQRYRYFSQYSLGCLLDEEGWYSVTPERVADQIAERCRCDTILDAFCGVGGNAIAFARTCQRVIALDVSPIRLQLARHNAQIYGVADRIEFILADYRSFAKAYLSQKRSRTPNNRKIDVVFLSPPWGGPSYLLGTTTSSSGQANSPPNEASSASAGAVAGASAATVAPLPIEAHPVYSLSSIQPIPGDELFRLTRQITPNIAYYLPRSTDLSEISTLLSISDEIHGAGRAAGAGTGDEGGPERNATGIDIEKTGGGAGAKDEKLGPHQDQEGEVVDGVGEGDGVVQGERDGQAPGHQHQHQEAVEVEEEWMGSKLKALTCYFGGLAASQEHLY